MNWIQLFISLLIATGVLCFGMLIKKLVQREIVRILNIESRGKISNNNHLIQRRINKIVARSLENMGDSELIAFLESHGKSKFIQFIRSNNPSISEKEAIKITKDYKEKPKKFDNTGK